MNVKNRKCIRKLSLKSLYANRRRNLIAIFAIALTTLLFTSMFTIVLSLNASYETYQFRQVGGYAHGTFKDVSPEQAEHILHGKVQLCRAVIPLCLCDHLRRDVCRLDVRRRVYDVFCDQSRAGCQLQHRFCFHHRPDQLIHLVIRRPILSHKAVVPTGISVPEILSFFHSRCPYLFFVSLPPCVSQQDFTAPLNLPMRPRSAPGRLLS